MFSRLSTRTGTTSASTPTATMCFTRTANGSWQPPHNTPQPNPEPEPTPEPVKSPAAVKEQNFGVDKAKLTGEDKYTINTDKGSADISKQEAHKIVGAQLQDDSNKLRVTIIGDDGTQKKVMADIHSLIKDINDWAIVRGYPPGHWCASARLRPTGSPTIYCQTPGGKVLHLAGRL